MQKSLCVTISVNIKIITSNLQQIIYLQLLSEIPNPQNSPMKLAERQRSVSTHKNTKSSKNLEKSRSKYYESIRNKDLSYQERIYNRNFFLREAYKAMIQRKHEEEIKELANSQKLDPASYKILKQKLQHKIQKAVQEVCHQNQQSHKEQVTFEQMCQIILETNSYLRKQQNAMDVEQFFSQLWLYLKNYDIENEYLDANILCTFIKILMDPKCIKPVEIQQLMMTIEQYKNSNQLLQQFILKYPELQEEALNDIQIFKLWYTIRQKYNLFHNNNSHSRRSLHKNQFTFQPEISQNSRIYAEKSLRKYLSSNKLIHEKNMKSNQTNEEENQLHQYLSHKVMGNSNFQRKSIDSLQKNDFSYHDLLYKRKLEKQDLSKRLQYEQSQSKQNLFSRRAHPQQIKQIVNKMYYVPEKRPDLDYKTLRQEEELKSCTFHPSTLEYHNERKSNVCVNGFEKQVSRLKKGRQEKEKLKEIYDNLGKPKNVRSHSRTPSFLQRDTPKLILEVNIGGGRVEKIKLHGNEDAKIVAKKFINKHSLQSSMLSVLQQLIDQNLKNL